MKDPVPLIEPISAKKNALFNVANIIKGGAVQAAVNFIKANQNTIDTSFIWYFVLSPEVSEELRNANIPLPQKTLIVHESPTHNKKVRQQILMFEKNSQIDIVFTLFGPCYINFKATHISGFANGWVTHSTFSTFIDTYQGNLLKVIKSILKYCFYALHIRRASGWIFETETARIGFIKRLFVNKDKCFVVPNTSISFGEAFTKVNDVTINNITLKHRDNLVVALAADYPQKNLQNILKAALYLTQINRKLPFKIIFTLPEDVFAREFTPFIVANKLQSRCLNIGKIDVADLSKLYSVASLSILASFIETFSAVYPESFATNTPVITSNKAFAKEICKDAAVYVDPKSSSEIAEAINLLFNDTEKHQQLIDLGQSIYTKMLTPEEKYQEYIKVLVNFV